jgi:hypothetical protein
LKGYSEVCIGKEEIEFASGSAAPVTRNTLEKEWKCISIPKNEEHFAFYFSVYSFHITGYSFHITVSFFFFFFLISLFFLCSYKPKIVSAITSYFGIEKKLRARI